MEDILLLNNLEGCTLYELYAGGAGASLNILFSGLCNNLVLNDLDFHIYAFWYSILNKTEEFLRLVKDTKITMNNWYLQKHIYDNFAAYDVVDVGFSTFFLNRCNRSGILYKAGPIGGKDQTGNYKIDVRFNKWDLMKRIEDIAHFSDRIQIFNMESQILIKEIFRQRSGKKFLFLDPPYYVQGENLYMNCYVDQDHVNLADMLHANAEKNWFLTYDNCERINFLYRRFRKSNLSMSYTLQTKRSAKEVMVFSDSLYLPKQLRVGSKVSKLNLMLTNQ